MVNKSISYDDLVKIGSKESLGSYHNSSSSWFFQFDKSMNSYKSICKYLSTPDLLVSVDKSGPNSAVSHNYEGLDFRASLSTEEDDGEVYQTLLLIQIKYDKNRVINNLLNKIKL
jgi:hypothetical protein